MGRVEVFTVEQTNIAVVAYLAVTTWSSCPLINGDKKTVFISSSVGSCTRATHLFPE